MSDGPPDLPPPANDDDRIGYWLVGAGLVLLIVAILWMVWT